MLELVKDDRVVSERDLEIKDTQKVNDWLFEFGLTMHHEKIMSMETLPFSSTNYKIRQKKSKKKS